MFREMAEKEIFREAQSCAFDYADKALERNVFPDGNAIRNLELFDESLPDDVGNASEIVRQLHTVGSPATVSQIGGRYFGLVNGGVVPAALAAKWLNDFWDQNTPLYVTSPVTSKIESVVEGWLKELLGIPQSAVAGFVSGSSMSIFCGLAAARYRVLQNAGWDVNAQGLAGAPFVRIVTSRQAHGAVIKAIALLGFGIDNIEWVDADEQGRIMVDQVPKLDDRTILILQAGNVNSGAFDDFSQLVDQAKEAGAWVHIDGAFGLWAAGCVSLQHLTAGIENADSWSLDGHKTLNTPYDSGIILCREKDALVHALQASGSYIIYSNHRDGMHFTPEMSRRGRAIEMWAALKYLGRAGVDELVLGLHQRALQMRDELVAADFEIVNDVVFNQVLVGCENDDVTARAIEYIQQSGECWVGGTNWLGHAVIRVSVCSWATTEADITRSANVFIAARGQARKIY
jgi:glutamate/tyrosine decarboxylase-like PLP-dependent enzyme